MSRILPLVALALALAACGDDAAIVSTVPATIAGAPTTGATTTGAEPTTTAPEEDLPPHTFDDLAPILDPLVEPLGFRVTRASLISLDTYQATADGTHLAVYVVPLADQTPDRYARQIVPLAAAFLPSVFDRWPALLSFDVCQEPFGWDGEGTPPSLTIVDLDRDASQAVDWATLDLAGLIEAAADDSDLTLSVSTDIGRSMVFRDAARPEA